MSNKNIVLHPVDPATGELDTNTNLYPKTTIKNVEGLNEKLSGTYTTCTLPEFSGAGNKAIEVSGVTANSTPILDVITSTTADTAATQLEAWSHIYAATTAENTITFYSDGATSEITVAVKGY